MSDPQVVSEVLKAIDAGARAGSELFDAVILPVLEDLEKDGRLEFTKGIRGSIRLPNDPRRPIRTHKATLDTEVLRALPEVGVSGGEVSRVLGFPPSSIRASLRRLAGAGLVVREGSCRWARWRRAA